MPAPIWHLRLRHESYLLLNKLHAKSSAFFIDDRDKKENQSLCTGSLSGSHTALPFPSLLKMK